MGEQIDLIGLSEVAEMFGVSRQVVANWRSRYADFPGPLAELKGGPVWQRRDMVAWADHNKVPLRGAERAESTEEEERMAITTALVNMKGGVGKSTIAANLGWYCAQRRNKRVLLVDLDPQFNLSQYILGVAGYEAIVNAGHKTTLHIFEQFTPSVVSGAPKTELNPSDVIKNVRTWRDGSIMDLVPSHLDLAWTLKNPHAKERLLNDFLDETRGNYDLILIDCPPTESMLTTAAYLASDYILVPVRPEFLSTIGLPLLVHSLTEFTGIYKKTVDLAGILFNATGDKREHQLSRIYVAKIAMERKWYLFKNEITYSDSYSKGSRLGRPIFSTDYARYSKRANFAAVADEFIGRIGL